MQDQVSKATYETWLKDTRGLNAGNGFLVVEVPTGFAAAWLTKMNSLIKRTLIEVTGQELEVRFQVQEISSRLGARP